ncbi:hypothetical protein LguiB_022556 [Lonicera macranthoides]
MSGWISSKLKVAETLLQQIDQQAAESLRKNEKARSDEIQDETLTRTAEILPLKDQLKKKTPDNNDIVCKLGSDKSLSAIHNNHSLDGDKQVAKSVNLTNPKSSLTDSDWTELLSAPNKRTLPPGNSNNGIRSLRKGGRRQGSSGSNSLGLDGKKNQKAQSSVVKSVRNLEVVLESKVNGGVFDARRSDGEDSRHSDSMPSTSSSELRSDGENFETREVDGKDASGGGSIEVKHRSEANEGRDGELETLRGGGQLHSKDQSVGGVSNTTNESRSLGTVPANEEQNRFRSAMGWIDEANAGPRSSASVKRGSSSSSDEGSNSDSDSTSSSDSEVERRREERRRRREQILAEKAAAKAIEAIKERENLVARLEGEKQSLEKILEERAKQQAQEASELQMTMMETMDAVDLEKQKHNNTRMEALARLAKLETTNGDLARSLASAQWTLEQEVNRVAELRQNIELKQVTHEELRRKISGSHETSNNLVASKGIGLEHGIFEAEYMFIADKVGRLQEKARAMEASIEMTRNEIESPTEVEVELKRRLSQLTDHLIQKQAQVESLSSEKAMLLFRIESVSRLLDENKSISNTAFRGDLESGSWDLSNSNLRPMLEDRLRSGQKHLGSLVRQLDSIFSAGAVFLRRNSTARIWAVVYLVCLHLWVLYILKSHSPVSEGAGSIVSLENLNNTGV